MDWQAIKLISAFLLPPLNFLLIGVLGFALLRRHPRWGRKLVGVALALLGIFSLPIVGTSLAMLLEKDSASAVVLPTTAQAIVVLGGGIHFGVPDYPQGAVGKETLQRLRYAAILHRRTGLPVLVTGGDLQQRGVAEADLMRRVLEEDFRVPVRWVERRSHDTIQNAAYSRPILEAGGIRRVLLVTHGWHMPRSRAIFEGEGFEVVPAATGFHSLDPIDFLAFLPNAEGLENSRVFFHEVMGRVWSELRRPGRTTMATRGSS